MTNMATPDKDQGGSSVPKDTPSPGQRWSGVGWLTAAAAWGIYKGLCGTPEELAAFIFSFLIAYIVVSRS